VKRLIVVTCLMVVTALSLAPVASASVKLTRPERELLALINHARARHGLQRVTVARTLERAARAHSREMVTKDYFTHSSFSGESFSARIIRFGYTFSGCTRWTVGEDIAYGRGSLGSPKAIFRAWMHSKPHRQVILTKLFRNAGIGRARGDFRGMDGVIFFTLDCGARVR